MPVYIYQCEDCSAEFRTHHGMTENLEACESCDSKNIARKPTLFTNLTKEVIRKDKVGDLTNKFIENSKEDLKKQKKGLDNKR